MEKLAKRIRARAIRRCGELLKMLDGRKGQNLPNSKSIDTDIISKTEAATAAGLSKRQKDQAVNMANIPEEKFETR